MNDIIELNFKRLRNKFKVGQRIQRDLMHRPGRIATSNYDGQQMIYGVVWDGQSIICQCKENYLKDFKVIS